MLFIHHDGLARAVDDIDIAGAAVQVAEEDLAEAADVKASGQHAVNAAAAVIDRHSQHDEVSAVHLALDGVADHAAASDGGLEKGLPAHVLYLGSVAGVGGAFLCPIGHAHKGALTDHGPQQVAVFGCNRVVLSSQIIGQALQVFKLQVHDVFQVVALTGDIVGQLNPRGILHSLLDAVEKYGNADAKIA
ncbi:hypothetical protein SDC9_160786 [bioreactor metagenome]|uniref:Uncharacterized protein n=1 Tax=bioreactor metagenome TaxID=1076179 RepID=A0A645FGD3_9ZZZZ